jgi:sterol desaturase/sphingolipid hydroxylase (fatty acid hydroxylase superfamily)
MIQTLADIQPAILIALLIVMYSIENIRPYLPVASNKRQHDLRNLIIIAINFLVNGAISFGVLYVIQYTHDQQLGLFFILDAPEMVETIAGVLLLDFGGYCLHNLQHKVFLLWRLHRVHHSDLSVNSTTSLRFHPLETVLTQGVYFSIVTPLLGISLASFVIYGTLNLILIILNHSNVRFPVLFEKFGRFVFVTPGWHKIHHSDNQKYTDSHYGDIFTFWDRIFGTWHKINPEDINFGLEEFADSDKHKVGFLIKSPFIDVRKTLK